MTRPFYWSLHRELWENRSIYVAPLLVAAVVLLGSLIHAVMLPQRIPNILAFDGPKQRLTLTLPYTFVAGVLMMTSFFVGAFYSMDALHGERRDRSILFWKSLPVSDRTIVLSKAAIPLAVLPLFIFALIVTTQVIMLMESTLMLSGNGRALSALWSNLKFVRSSIALFYGVVVIALWHAPIHAWFILVSGWARRAVFIWALLPPLALCAFERIAFGTNVLFLMLGHRLTGWFVRAFAPRVMKGVPMDPIEAMEPLKFVTSPGLWFGLIFAALFLVLASRLRRYRDPI